VTESEICTEVTDGVDTVTEQSSEKPMIVRALTKQKTVLSVATSDRSFMKVNMDLGIASTPFQPSYLIGRKSELLALLAKSENMQGHEHLDH